MSIVPSKSPMAREIRDLRGVVSAMFLLPYLKQLYPSDIEPIPLRISFSDFRILPKEQDEGYGLECDEDKKGSDLSFA